MPIKIAMSAKNSGQGWLQRRNQMDEESMPTYNAPDPSHAQNIHNSPLLRLRRRGSLVCAHYIAFLFKFACPLSDSERECEWIFPTLPWVCVLDSREKRRYSRVWGWHWPTCILSAELISFLRSLAFLLHFSHIAQSEWLRRPQMTACRLC